MNYDKNSVDRLFVILSLVLFIIWYFFITTCNRFAVDDYWHGISVNQYGVIGHMLNFYYTWEGSLSHTLFADLPHLLGIYQNRIFLINWFVFIGIFVSITIILKALFAHHKISKILILSLFLLSYLYLTLFPRSELFFWMSVNLTYTLAIAEIAIFTYLLMKQWDYYSLIPASFLLLNKVNVALFIFMIYLLFRWNYMRSRKTIICLIFMTALLLVNVLAPGNFERQAHNLNGMHYNFEGLMYALFNNFYFVLTKYLPNVLGYSSILFILSMYLSKILGLRLNQDYKPSIKIALFFLLLYTSLNQIIFTISFQDFGPIRAYYLIPVCAYVFAFIGGVYLENRLRNGKFNLSIMVVGRLLMAAMLIFILWNYTYISKALKYKGDVDRRSDIMLSLDPDEPEVILNPVGESGIIHSVWMNDKTWLNNVYRKYYNFNGKIILQAKGTN